MSDENHDLLKNKHTFTQIISVNTRNIDNHTRKSVLKTPLLPLHLQKQHLPISGNPQTQNHVNKEMNVHFTAPKLHLRTICGKINIL